MNYPFYGDINVVLPAAAPAASEPSEEVWRNPSEQMLEQTQAPVFAADAFNLPGSMLGGAYLPGTSNTPSTTVPSASEDVSAAEASESTVDPASQSPQSSFEPYEPFEMKTVPTQDGVHPTGLPPPPSGKLDVPPGAYQYTGPPLKPNALGNATWMADEEAQNCMRCGQEFTLITRRHHCRQCGEIFCHRCCNSRCLLQPGSGTAPNARVDAHPVLGASQTDEMKPQKVCGKCFDLLLPMQPYLTATCSKAAQPGDFSKPSVVQWAGKFISRSFKLEIKKAVHTLESFLGMPDDNIVRNFVERAHGIAFLTIYKVGFLGAVTAGGGIILAKDAESKEWSAPCCVGCGGVSIGAQVGGELNTVMLILNSADAVSAFTGSAQMTLGVNVSVALGPLGRTIEGTGVAGYNNTAACYSYSNSRGAFAGVGLDGTLVFTRDRLNHSFYGHPASAKQLLSGMIQPPRAAEPLYAALRRATAEWTA